MLKVMSLFTGIGAFEKALERLNINYELVGFSEIDKFAIKSYCAIHNVPEYKNLGDVTKIDIDKIPEFDLLTWGFPCQDISIAGRMEGIKEGTRSGLYYEGYKILKAKMPSFSIIENVKNLTSQRFKNQFDSILNDISELGYNNYWKVLNAKDFGVPQNRERIFIVSIRKDVDKNEFTFPSPVTLNLKLKDILEDKVDEKFYLTESGIGRLIKKNNKLLRDYKNPNICSCIIAGYSKMSGSNNQYIAENNKPNKIAGMYDTETKKRQAGSIYNTEGISPTLTTMSNGGHKQPYILVKEGTKKGYAEAMEGDSINYSYPNSTTKRGRVGKEVSQTILTSPSMATVIETPKPICLNNQYKQPSVQDRIYDTEGIATAVTASQFRPSIAERKMFNPYNQKEIKDIAPTQTASCGNVTSTAAVLISEDGNHYMKIRKLTPLECWRLMGFDDDDFEKAKLVPTSDTQLYRQAGNSIVVNVLEAIFKNLLIKK
ncbi:DNA (cytosine-5-)-methyltransferase [uncultured Clostridium sp.]|uniref:DNA (cytosine-5-)-methyltransferase n=1 Tax=uncultured Clostridium sp. TaxID=59620 RepID=UPI002638F7FF|nr:DNA (cytosine-5-)-methyltransferase [uncultured Clostridium sp.]MCI8310113.1 DNA cytosine methyltransferase [Clostridia bacterium]